MNRRLLQFFSLVISALALLYLLFANLIRGTFVAGDLLVVSVDLGVKVVIEAVIVFNKG